MPIRPDCIRRPAAPVPRDYVPPSPAIKRRVRDGESWITLARELSARAQASIDPWYLIRFNYPTLPADQRVAALEVNWYLQEYVGCRRLTPDSSNYVFSSADPGHVYIPDVAAPSTPSTSLRLPVLRTIKERRDSIMANTPGVIAIAEDATVKSNAHPSYSIEAFEEVSANLLAIESLARKYSLDPDFVKAVVWMETTHGYYDRLNPWNKTIRPMNVHYKLWSDLGISKDTLQDPAINTAAGVHILSAIWERTEQPTPEKVATLYNELGASKVNAYGKAIAEYMAKRPWLRKK